MSPVLLPSCMQGFAVVDNVFGNIVTHQLKLEVERLYSSGMMHLNHTHLVQQGVQPEADMY
jgi:hypothetical protein